MGLVFIIGLSERTERPPDRQLLHFTACQLCFHKAQRRTLQPEPNNTNWRLICFAFVQNFLFVSILSFNLDVMYLSDVYILQTHSTCSGAKIRNIWQCHTAPHLIEVDMTRYTKGANIYNKSYNSNESSTISSGDWNKKKIIKARILLIFFFGCAPVRIWIHLKPVKNKFNTLNSYFVCFNAWEKFDWLQKIKTIECYLRNSVRKQLSFQEHNGAQM